ncbi:hypothetical protein F2Q68_00016421 [Brassica cretica]|uniref:Arabidopsis retrotransposon Orf1 C-terminal domain-containing protein n=1 Tax=Brassica cretica TaxID=69181 RepID=A0A8S9HC70_BRACR|nr:hypothetical protein F2Q68_00016421 [Brassica cretica]
MDRASIDAMPTRFGHAENLAALGIDTDVFDIIQAMGIALLCYQTHELYPDLVRQVLATAHIGYENPSAHTYENWSFSFIADEKFWSLSLDKPNEIYEIVDEPKEVAVEKNFAPSNAFWDLISNCRFTSRKAYQSQIRNPTLRVIAKMVSNLLFAKDQTSKVTNRELQMLYTGVEDEIRRARAAIPIQPTLWDQPPIIRRQLRDRVCRHSLSDHMPHPSRRDHLQVFGQGGEHDVLQAPADPPNNLQHGREHRFLPDPEFLCIDPRAPPTDADMDDVEDITPDAAAAYD